MNASKNKEVFQYISEDIEHDFHYGDMIGQGLE